MWWKKETKEPVALIERLGTLERQVKELRLEWESVHDKLVSLVHRFNKRAERIADAERQEVPESGTPTGTPTAISPQRLDPMSQRILDRRARIFARRSTGNSPEREQ